tara:strand:+ start:17037 stop:17249 length:213 start_codon:yes stop_codon:yes gene_type:complete
MTMVKLNTEIAVNPAEVASVHIERQGMTDQRYHYVAVTLKCGTQHRVEPSYNESIWKAHDRVLAKLEPDG